LARIATALGSLVRGTEFTASDMAINSVGYGVWRIQDWCRSRNFRKHGISWGGHEAGREVGFAARREID
jgi:hypothetical protein